MTSHLDEIFCDVSLSNGVFDQMPAQQTAGIHWRHFQNRCHCQQSDPAVQGGDAQHFRRGRGHMQEVLPPEGQRSQRTRQESRSLHPRT